MDRQPATREAWIAAAIDRYERPLLHYAARITRDVELARDVVQETFLRLCQADRAKIGGYLAPWLYTVCRNQALNTREKEARMTQWRENAIDTPGNAAPVRPGDAAARKETHERVLAIVDGLPGEQQEAFWLKFRDGLTYREIASIMDISLGGVGNLIAGALNAVRNEMRAEMGLAKEVQS